MFFVTDTASEKMIAVPVVFSIVMLLLGGGIAAALGWLLFKRKKEMKSLRNIHTQQSTSTSSGDNCPNTVERQEAICVCTQNTHNSCFVHRECVIFQFR